LIVVAPDIMFDFKIDLIYVLVPLNTLPLSILFLNKLKNNYSSFYKSLKSALTPKKTKKKKEKKRLR
jgi:hypothetical protein